MGNRNKEVAVSLTAIGERLKSAREKKGVTIDQAQRQTHIHSTVLSALENGRSDEILTPTYVKSFLKKYSAYLDLDSNQMIKEYAALHPDIESPSVNIGSEALAIKSGFSSSGILRFIRNVVIVGVAAFVLVLIVKGAVRFIKFPHKAVAKKVSTQVKQPQRVAAKQTQKKVSENTQIPQISIPDNEQIALIMKVKADVYVGVKRDGVLQFKRLLPKGTIETFTADQKLNISIAKARSVELTLNGRPLGAVGKGAIRDLEITRKGIKVK